VYKADWTQGTICFLFISVGVGGFREIVLCIFESFLFVNSFRICMDDYVMMVTWFEDGMGWEEGVAWWGKEVKRWMGWDWGLGVYHDGMGHVHSVYRERNI
jgi:hypothetical protein